MIQFIIDLLTPVFEKLGVSPVDVKQYVESLSGYIYAIVGLLALAVVVMVAAHWLVKKGNRHVVRWGAAVSWILAVTVIANVICFGPMYNNLAPILNGRASVSQESVDASMDMIQEVGEEGMVLTKNNGLLPLEGDSNLNVFGWAATNPIYGGTGSGSADNSDAVDILTSLSDAGFHVNQDLVDLYTEYSQCQLVKNFENRINSLNIGIKYHSEMNPGANGVDHAICRTVLLFDCMVKKQVCKMPAM